MKKSFLIALFALSIATSIPVAKVEAMNTQQHLKCFAEGAKEILKNKKNFMPLLIFHFFLFLYSFSNPLQNIKDKKFVLFVAKTLTYILSTSTISLIDKTTLVNSYYNFILIVPSIIPSAVLGIILNIKNPHIMEQIDERIQQKINQLILWYKFRKLISSRIVSQPCSICLEYNTTTDTSGSTTCNHTFHKDCIKPWLEKKLICPNCRANL